jgi:hypothetical protein
MRRNPPARDPESPLSIPRFDPVTPRPCGDPWTVERQVAFIAALAQSGCPRAAAARVGMSLGSAYRLYRRSGAAGFRRAWDKVVAGPTLPRRAQALPKKASRPLPLPGLTDEESALVAARMRGAIARAGEASTSPTYSPFVEGRGPFDRVRPPAGDPAR